MFIDDRLAFKVGNRVMDIRTAVPFNEKCRVRLKRNMLNMDMRFAALAKALQKHIGVLRSCQRLHQWILPTGKILVPAAYGAARKISFPVAVLTPRYSNLPGDPLQAASTQIDGRAGCVLASFHFPSEEGLPLNFSYFIRNAASASASLPKALYCALTKPCTCFSHAAHEVKTPVLRPCHTT